MKKISSKMFSFKQFTVHQDHCAMKVGTDGVLLGAWAPVFHNPFSVLDIGAGTGLLSLMLAQRCSAEQIDAVEIDGDAYEQCVENFEASNWNDRLFCYHAPVDAFTDEMFEEEEEYDLIVSNPPFYSENFTSGDQKRDQARFQESLPFEELIECAQALLSDNGVFAVIIPFKEEARFTALAASVNLFPFKITHVKGTPLTEIKRSLIAFSRLEQVAVTDELIIEEGRHEYTEAYRNLTKDFYLRF